MNNLVLLLKVQLGGLLTNTTQFSKKKWKPRCLIMYVCMYKIK